MSPSAGSRRSREGWRETADPALAPSGSLVRFSIAAVIVIAFTATTTAVRGLLQFKQLVADISAVGRRSSTRGSRSRSPGNPQTILLIGSDHRCRRAVASQSNTDTMMLVRLDAGLVDDQRDVGAARPQGRDPRGGGCTDKINAAYSIGGAQPAGQGAQERVPRASDQPHHRRQLRRLRGAGQRDRLRLHRRRSPLLQQHRVHRLFEHRPAARLPAPVRFGRAVVRALPPHRLRPRAKRRASRTSSAGPRRSTASDSWSPTATSCCGSSASTRRPTPICTRSTGS